MKALTMIKHLAKRGDAIGKERILGSGVSVHCNIPIDRKRPAVGTFSQVGEIVWLCCIERLSEWVDGASVNVFLRNHIVKYDTRRVEAAVQRS
jgi:hypothetical protein